MTVWDSYPEDYRSTEVGQILRAAGAGECVAVIGLSGSGKSNLMGFLAQRVTLPQNSARFILIDCNRLVEPSLSGFYRMLLLGLSREKPAQLLENRPADELLASLETALTDRLSSGGGVCLLLDRFDALFALDSFQAIAGSLRVLRDEHKYSLSYVIAARRPLPSDNELAELFFGRTIWLGPLSPANAFWSAQRDASRFSSWGNRDWSAGVLQRLVDLSGGYPSFLRAACEAYSDGAELTSAALQAHPAVRRRLDEFWADGPDDAALRAARLDQHPWLAQPAAEIRATLRPDSSQLTAKESRLLEYLQAHAGQVCDKDDLVQAVWPEEVIFERGVRDESLAQLVRRLRIKVEADPSDPQRLVTIPGRGYLYKNPNSH